MNKPAISVSAGGSILLALMLLLLPLQWIVAALAAAAFHELCHYCAIRLCSRHRSPVRFFVFGARMPLPSMSRSRELLCALAGPVGSLILLLFAKWLPRTAICAAFQSAYNLLPVYPMDGGRAVSCILHMLFPPPKAQKGCKILEHLCLGALMLLGFWGFFVWRLGIGALLPTVILILRLKIVKMPCKVTL